MRVAGGFMVAPCPPDLAGEDSPAVWGSPRGFPSDEDGCLPGAAYAKYQPAAGGTCGRDAPIPLG